MFDAVANSRVDRQRVDGRNETSDLIGTTRSAVPGNGRVKEEYTTPSLNPNFVAYNVEAAAPTFSSEPTWNTGEQDENGSVIGAKKKINNEIEVDAQHDSRHIWNDAFEQPTSSIMTESRKEVNSMYSSAMMIRNKIQKPENQLQKEEEKRKDIGTIYDHTFRVNELLAKKHKILGGNIQAVDEKTGDLLGEEITLRI